VRGFDGQDRSQGLAVGVSNFGDFEGSGWRALGEECEYFGSQISSIPRREESSFPPTGRDNAAMNGAQLCVPNIGGFVSHVSKTGRHGAPELGSRRLV
jgi:hypothetical protein